MINDFIELVQANFSNDFALKDIVPFLQFLIYDLKPFGKKTKAAIEKNQIVNNYYYINGDMIINNK